MPSSKEIRSKIASTKNTQKITKALQMVSAGKIRKAEKRMQASRPYVEKIFDVAMHLAMAHSEFKHSFLNVRPLKRIGLVIITTDRGLCGGLNANLLRMTLKEIKKWQAQHIEVDLCLVGNKADTALRHTGNSIVSKIKHMGDDIHIAGLIGPIKIMLDLYNNKKIDALYISYNKFVNTMVQKPIIQQLLPIVSDETKKHYWDYIYEPETLDLLDRLLRRYIEVGIYQSMVENIACEHSARMIAMLNATENAGKLIHELQLDYNKARQAAITQEITEIISGAKAVE
ncbi:MAG: F0F1 ATP synthase subunit gamma [Gammaproteobacteria bacterium]|nr:F0F1 ATP synthase subunit gamma [Gammaproteobacteria bacterium]